MSGGAGVVGGEFSGAWMACCAALPGQRVFWTPRGKAPTQKARPEEGQVEPIAVVNDPNVIAFHLLDDFLDDAPVVGPACEPLGIEAVGAEDSWFLGRALDDATEDNAEVGAEVGGFEVNHTTADLGLGRFHRWSPGRKGCGKRHG